MHPTIEKLLAGHKTIITDGAWGTQLQLRGLKTSENPDAWSLSNPEAVESVANDYIGAGSQVILTNTFGANRYVLARFGLQDKVSAINAAGITISKKAAKNHAYVFASMGPSGQLLMKNDTLKQQLYDAFEEQALAIESAGADAIVIETMTNLREAEVAIAAARRTKLPIVACAVIDSGKEKDRTMMGDTIEKVIEVFSNAGVDVIGMNCGQGITGFIPTCRRMRSLTDLPLWMKPNAGLPVFENGKATYNANAEDFANRAMDLVEAGADFIGGCCGTSPEFIRALSKRLRDNG
jgi:5-methyltetrahydrofolate--homocysteine methyltransferase